MDFYKRLQRLNESTVLLEYNRKDLRNFAGDEYANKFFTLRDRLQAPENDLGHWIKKGDVAAFKKFIDDWESGATKSKTQKKKEERIAGAELIFDDKGWKVYHITTYDAAKQLGSGTTWCITGRYRGYERRGEEFFNNYIRDYKLDGYYFIFDTLNKDPNTNDYLKYCAGVTKDGRLVFLYNGMQDREISKKGIPNIPEERRVDLLGSIGVKVPFYDPLTIENGVLKKVDREALSGEVILPEGVEVIDKFVFENSTLNTIKFPSTLKVIKTGAFASSRLKTLALPENVEQLGTGAFMETELVTAKLNESLKVIPKRCFAYCEALMEVKLPDNVEAIADDAFEYCSSDLKLYTKGLNEVVNNFAKSQGINYLDIETNELYSAEKA